MLFISLYGILTLVMEMKKFIISLFLLFFLIMIFGVYLFKNSYDDGLISSKDETKKSEHLTPADSPTYKAKVWATGDIMYHRPLYANNFDSSTGKYTFNTYFQKVSEYLHGADLVLGNFETTVNPNKPISGHPLFNTPPEALDYLKSVGFDALSTSNNHCLDTGYDGVHTTIDAIEKSGLKHFGTRKNGDSPLIITVNGIAVGLLSYSEMFNGLDGLVPHENRLEISPLQEDLILGDIKNLKGLGADYIIAYPHWGNEYTQEPTENQKYFNQFLLENGVDAVLGSHPHVLQRVETQIINGQNKFSIYSMGNAISNQRHQWLNEKGVESGVFIELNLIKKGDKTTLESFVLHPTYANRYVDEFGKYQTELILYSDLLESGKYRNSLTPSLQQFIDLEYQWVADRLKILRSN